LKVGAPTRAEADRPGDVAGETEPVARMVGEPMAQMVAAAAHRGGRDSVAVGRVRGATPVQVEARAVRGEAQAVKGGARAVRVEAQAMKVVAHAANGETPVASDAARAPTGGAAAMPGGVDRRRASAVLRV